MPIQLIWGEEEYNIDKRLKEIKKAILKDNITPLNYRKTDNPAPEKFDEILRTQGMMFGDILFVVNADRYFMNVKKAYTLSEKEGDELVKSIENLSPSIHVVLVCKLEQNSGKKPDSRKKLYKAVSKYGKIEEYPIFKYYETGKAVLWVKARAQELGLKITHSQAEQLVNGTGTYLRDLDSNLEKLVLEAYPEKTVTNKMLEALTNDNSDIHDILDYFISGKKDEALHRISLFLEKQNVLTLLSFLQAAITRLLQTKIYTEKFPIAEVTGKLGLPEFVVKQNASKVENMKTKDIVSLKQNLTDIEYKIKTGEISDPLLAFGLVLNGGAQ